MADQAATEDDREAGGTPALEWIAAGVGLMVTLMMLGFVGWQAIGGPDNLPPDIVVQVERTMPVAHGWVVEIAVTNRSPATADQVVVEGELLRGDDAVATAQATFDYVPGQSEVHGGLFLAQDPSTGEVRLRALGYAKP